MNGGDRMRARIFYLNLIVALIILLLPTRIIAIPASFERLKEIAISAGQDELMKKVSEYYQWKKSITFSNGGVICYVIVYIASGLDKGFIGFGITVKDNVEYRISGCERMKAKYYMRLEYKPDSKLPNYYIQVSKEGKLIKHDFIDENTANKKALEFLDEIAAHGLIKGTKR